jgi:peptidoglycan-associated lipoprotein
MRLPIRRTAFWLAVALATALFASGCAKKAVQAPPAPAPVPPTEAPAPTPTPPAPTPEPPPTPGAEQLIASLRPAFFALDSYGLDESARAALDADARILRDNPMLVVIIEGHCDERGTAEYNQALGQRRAEAAREYLTNAGIPATRMQIVSYGKERPFDEGHDEAAWAKNRRAHFTKP